eukprot:TRINITY_DN1935_c0_g1_i4.p1 TRINITY_DN1935_c0_g1~~TRINITY_DN1935_c0_g1_i4.p1  ORF type:complete len:250 (-),score=35.21 TRINITY_DN1935_c0_g1_i4:155-817(-)
MPERDLCNWIFSKREQLGLSWSVAFCALALLQKVMGKSSKSEDGSVYWKVKDGIIRLEVSELHLALISLTLGQQCINTKPVPWPKLEVLLRETLPPSQRAKTKTEFISEQLELMVAMDFDLAHTSPFDYLDIFLTSLQNCFPSYASCHSEAICLLCLLYQFPWVLEKDWKSVSLACIITVYSMTRGVSDGILHWVSSLPCQVDMTEIKSLVHFYKKYLNE